MDHFLLFPGLDFEDSIEFKYINPNEGINFFLSLTCEEHMRVATLFVIMMLSVGGLISRGLPSKSTIRPSPHEGHSTESLAESKSEKTLQGRSGLRPEPPAQNHKN